MRAAREQDRSANHRAGRCASRPVSFGSAATSARQGLVFENRCFFVRGQSARSRLCSAAELRGHWGGEELGQLRLVSKRADEMAAASLFNALAGRCLQHGFVSGVL